MPFWWLMQTASPYSALVSWDTFERNCKLHVDEDKLGPGTAWKVFTSLETVSTDCLQQTAAWRVQNQRFIPAVRWWRGVSVADYMGDLLATWCRENVQYKVQT